MNKAGRLIRAAAAVLLSITVAGCGLVQVNEERDRRQVVAEVNGEEIMKGDFLDEYSLALASYPYQLSPEDEEEMRVDVLDRLIRQRIILQEAGEAGFVLNDQVRAEAEQEFEEDIQEYADEMEAEAAEDEEADEEVDYLVLAREMVDNWLTSMGMTRSEYLERLAVDRVMRSFMEELTQEVSISDEAINDYYQEERDFQIANPQYIGVSQVQIVTEPEMRRVKHILVALPQEETDEIGSLRQQGLNEEADTLRAEKLEAIRSRAEEVLSQAEAGEDFEALIAEYGEDPGMELEENLEGYHVFRDSPMVPEFKEAAFGLREGQISGLVETDFGYHILKAYEDRDNEIEPLAEIRDDIESVLESRERNARWSGLVEQWEEDAVIQRYERRLS